MSACSRGLALLASAFAFCAAAKAGATASSCIGRLMLGTSASPQKHMAQSGSSFKSVIQQYEIFAVRLTNPRRTAGPQERSAFHTQNTLISDEKAKAIPRCNTRWVSHEKSSFSQEQIKLG